MSEHLRTRQTVLVDGVGPGPHSPFVLADLGVSWPAIASTEEILQAIDKAASEAKRRVLIRRPQ
ncbi:hypothetical protein HOU52_gp34 [Arthrobacter phage Yang]|uniref:Uncharacterized protein n=1 Tax=Arthrobacter phage Yang TaxID=2419970 RepID=A0A3G2KJK8_9CAUD|nr:hypothetical protein HOU52_gp34 [Arthrobacter phage Yang]AYN59120.1 hypothetical protein PBI_YANG_34 [Arthrobacter phage Yang]